MTVTGTHHRQVVKVL